MVEDVTAGMREQFGRAAAGWDRWSVEMQRDDAARYVEAAEVGRGDRVLEIGAGAGDQTLKLAERVGPEGRVIATDLTPEMLDIAARRVDDAGFSNVEFIVAGVDALDLQEASFDACVSGFTWEFLPDPVAAAATVRRLLAGGGRLAASVWGPGPEVPMRSIVGTVVLSELGIELPARDVVIDLADPSQFGQALASAGFEDVSVREFPVCMEWAAPDAYARSMRELAPQLQDLIEEHDPGRTEQIWDAVAEAAVDHVTGDGPVRMVNAAFLGVGVRPR